MKHSIRTRITLVFAGMMALMLLITWFVNSRFLESFYISEKVKVLEQGYQEIDFILEEQHEKGESMTEGFVTDDNYTYWARPYGSDMAEEGKLPKTLRKLSEESNTSIVMVNGMEGTAVMFAPRGEFMEQQMQRYLLGQYGKGYGTIRETENYSIEKRYDRISKNYYLECWGFFFDNETAFLMSMPVAGIQDSVRLSSRFLLYVGTSVLIIGSILMLVLTRRITSPIRSLSKISEKMSELDFDARYTGNAKDEVGILGNNMNLLSEKLKETIGELKSANNELQRDIRKKEQIDEMRKEFIANVSHELKTPIALIQGYAEGLAEGMAEEEESRDYYCEVIMDEANKMNKMVQQLLTLNALEFGSDGPSMEQFDIVELIQGVLSSAQILIEQKQAQIIFEADGPLHVWADEFKIEEVITNYVSNALNHLDGARIIRIQAVKEEREVRISVANTGNNIPEEDLPKIWSKFYKVDKARTREYGGSGIGLSIVKAIMEAHGKEYGAYNTPDGVEFYITLDCSK